MHIVPFSSDHIKDALIIEEMSFPTPWSYDAFLGELNLHNGSGLVCVSMAGKAERVVGYLLMRWVCDELEIVNLAVHPQMRRQGIARKLLRECIRQFGTRGTKIIFLEVREHNEPAIRLYLSFGFKQVGLRRSYYVDTGEDAILMRLDIDEHSNGRIPNES